jgi:endonuclease YncB( thermonuclease family)
LDEDSSHVCTPYAKLGKVGRKLQRTCFQFIGLPPPIFPMPRIWKEAVLFTLFLAALVLGLRGGRMTEARVVRVVDGDTLRVLLKNGEEEYVRLVGIDAPELKRGGEGAREFLSKLCPVGSIVRLEIVGRDKYRRLLAVVYNENGINANHRMLEENLAAPICLAG